MTEASTRLVRVDQAGSSEPELAVNRPAKRGQTMPSSSDRDSQLLAAVRDGDMLAFRQLYERYGGAVLAMARRRGCPEADAEDIAHEVFSALWNRPPRLESVRLTTWLYRVTANRVASLHRRHRVRRLFAERPRGPESGSPSPEGSVEARDLVAAVLGRMSHKKREVLVMFELEELSGAEIAERLGCNESTVFTRLHHARLQFAKVAHSLSREPLLLSPRGEP